jgi:hypothetical protein
VSKVLITDLFPVKQEVIVMPGKPGIDVRPLQLSEIVKLLSRHGDALVALYNESQKQADLQGNGGPNYEPVLLAAEPLVAEIIVMGADMEDQSEAVSMMPAGPKLQLLAAIWQLSVPDPKKLIESLSKLMVQAKRLVQEAAKEAQLDRESQSSPSDTPSSPIPSGSSAS